MKPGNRTSGPLGESFLRKTKPSGHFSEDLLEAYALNRMQEPEVVLLEEHLLICAATRSCLSEIDGCIPAMKATVAGAKRTPPRRCRVGSPLIKRGSPRSIRKPSYT